MFHKNFYGQHRIYIFLLLYGGLQYSISELIVLFCLAGYLCLNQYTGSVCFTWTVSWVVNVSISINYLQYIWIDYATI